MASHKVVLPEAIFPVIGMSIRQCPELGEGEAAVVQSLRPSGSE